ncbi:sld5 protein [Holotrichia oblita]|uniref:Sld5 protein n=1 Tax=Holotrichia oblita TaxID=644536 RepID=A0ACB9TF00_HOLOL|nr:sld5 protein [Holotrichia oblita]
MEDSINVEDFDSLGNEENEETEEVPLTAAEVIELMEEAWRNEKFAPDILPNKSEVVDCLLGQISYMEENLRIEQHFDDILSFWPGLPSDEWRNDPVIPNINSFVFLKSKNEIEGVVIDDGTEQEEDLVDFKTDSQLIISYNSVANLVRSGEVQLI